MKTIFNTFSPGALVAGLVPALVDCLLILAFDQPLDVWMLLQAFLFWFGCGYVVYRLNPKKVISKAVLFTFFLNLPWFISLAISSGNLDHLVPLMAASIVMGFGIGLITKWFSENRELTVEWAPFELLENITEDNLSEASQNLQKNFLEKQEGFVRRELLHFQDKKWVDLVYWKNKDFAIKAMEAVMKSEICQNYFKLMKPIEQGSDSGVLHLTKKCEYGKKEIPL